MNFNQFNRSISLNQNLANYTWFNVGGNAEILFIPNDIKELFDFLSQDPKNLRFLQLEQALTF